MLSFMVSIARSGYILVLGGKRIFPETSPDKMYERAESVFVQVFHIKPSPDIFLNETKRRRIFRIMFFSLLWIVPSDPKTRASILRNLSAGTTELRLLALLRSAKICLFLFCQSTEWISVMVQVPVAWGLLMQPSSFMLPPLDHTLSGLFKLSTSNWL